MRRILPAFVIAILCAGSLAAAEPASQSPTTPVTVVTNPQSPTSGIQEAIDSLGPAGGIVTIPPGEYSLRRSIRIRSNITLQGSGEKTILRKVRQLGSKLAAPAGKDDRSLRLENTTGFQSGDEIGTFDANTVGWEHAHAIIKEVREHELLLDRRVSRAFDPSSGAAVINYFPAITGTGIDHVVIKGLSIDGQADANPGPATVSQRGPGKPPELGFTFAAINLVDVTNSNIEKCSVIGWPADGISLQRGGHNHVARCGVEACRGEGFHPGGGLHDCEFHELESCENLANGFYFCARVERVTVRFCRFFLNHKNGIGSLGDSGDTNNLVEYNNCLDNGHSGIQLWDGTSNTVQFNHCRNNSQSAPGRYNGISIAATTKSTISNNHCFDDQPTKTQKHGIEETPNSSSNTITNNFCRDNLQAGLSLQGRDGQYTDNEK